MKTRIIILLVCILSSVQVISQNAASSVKVAILQQADEMGRAFVAKNYKAFAKFTHPTIVALMGGEEKMIGEMEKAFGALEKDGVTFKEVKFGEPTQVITVEEEIQTTLPQIIEMRIPGGNFTVNATLIAVSQDQGKSWYFIDISDTTLENMRKVIPSLSASLEIPDRGEPTFVEDAQQAPKQ